MKHNTIIFLLISSLVSFAQNDSIGVFIPKDDSSPFSWPIKHMWVGRKNPIVSTCIGSNEFIKIWTDNGVVDSGDYYLATYCIKPTKTGIINVYSIQQIWTGEKYDTVQTKDSFIGIIPPNISIEVTKDNFRKDSCISFSLINSFTLKPMGKRYEVGCLYQPLVYDQQGNLIGKIPFCFGTTIDFIDELNEVANRKLKVKSGYKIKIKVLVRDIKTDLLIPSNEILYTLK